jgi:hypothetical protein
LTKARARSSDHDEVRDDVCAFVTDALGDPEAVLG